MPESGRAMTLRLSDDLAEALDLIVAVDGQPASEVIRKALRAYITTRMLDADFQAGLRYHIAAMKRLLERESETADV